MDTRGEIMDCHALPCKARNDRKRGFFTQDSRSCGGALQALKNLGKVSDLVGRAFHKTRDTARRRRCFFSKFFNLVKLPTQDRIY